MEGKKDEDFGALSASFFSSFLDVDDEINKRSFAAEKEDVILLRFPICCVIGHTYIGKTKLLNYIRGAADFEFENNTTKRVTATYVPSKYIGQKTKELKPADYDNFPGLLFLDTPGHSHTSFTNLRSRGLALCDIAILFVDIIIGIQPQTIQSLNLLRSSNKKFIISLNKVDMLSWWKPCYNAPFSKSYKQQSTYTQNAFNTKLTKIITQFKEHGLSTEIYWRNKEMGETVSIVPTSASSGEGIPDLLLLLAMWSSKTMVDKLIYKEELQCTVLYVGFDKDRGTMMDVVLVNGTLCEGDRIAVCGRKGQIVTSIQSLWIPCPMGELGVEGNYFQYKKIKAVMGIKIFAQGIEDAILGSNLYLAKPSDDSKDVEEPILEDRKRQG